MNKIISPATRSNIKELLEAFRELHVTSLYLERRDLAQHYCEITADSFGYAKSAHDIVTMDVGETAQEFDLRRKGLFHFVSEEAKLRRYGKQAVDCAHKVAIGLKGCFDNWGSPCGEVAELPAFKYPDRETMSHEQRQLNLRPHTFWEIVQLIVADGMHYGYSDAIVDYNRNVSKGFRRSKYLTKDKAALIELEPDTTVYAIKSAAYDDHLDLFSGVHFLPQIRIWRRGEGSDADYCTERFTGSGWRHVAWNDTLRDSVVRLSKDLRYIERRAVDNAVYRAKRDLPIVSDDYTDDDMKQLLRSHEVELPSPQLYAVVEVDGKEGIKRYWTGLMDDMGGRVAEFTKEANNPRVLLRDLSFTQAEEIKKKVRERREAMVDKQHSAERIAELRGKIECLTIELENSAVRIKEAQADLEDMLSSAEFPQPLS